VARLLRSRVRPVAAARSLPKAAVQQQCDERIKSRRSTSSTNTGPNFLPKVKNSETADRLDTNYVLLGNARSLLMFTYKRSTRVPS